MKRREFITLLGGAAAAWPLAARAQQAAQIPQVGWIWPGAAAGNPSELAGFKQGLHELGYVEGRNIAVEYRFGENRAERLPEFAADLARLNASVIVAIGIPAIHAVQRAAPGIPIVLLTADPIAAGFVTNLSRPGGNITGVSLIRLCGRSRIWWLRLGPKWRCKRSLVQAAAFQSFSLPSTMIRSRAGM